MIFSSPSTGRTASHPECSDPSFIMKVKLTINEIRFLYVKSPYWSVSMAISAHREVPFHTRGNGHIQLDDTLTALGGALKGPGARGNSTGSTASPVLHNDLFDLIPIHARDSRRGDLPEPRGTVRHGRIPESSPVFNQLLEHPLRNNLQ